MSFGEWMTLAGVWLGVWHLISLRSSIDELRKDHDRISALRSDVDGLMVQTHKIEERQ
jgi:hypothetical protein